MKTYLSITLAFVLSMLAFTALADDHIDPNKLNFGVGWSMTETGEMDMAEKYNSLLLRGGFVVNDRLTVEGEAMFSISSSGDVSEAIQSASFSGYGLYAKHTFWNQDQLSIHGRLGYADDRFPGIKLFNKGAPDEEAAGVSMSDAGLSYGIGASWHMSDSTSLRFDWTAHEAEHEHGTALSLAYMVHL